MIPWARNQLKARTALLEKCGGSPWTSLDRFQILGDNTTGHWGCVNALSWSSDGRVLISSGDDRRICLWQQTGTEYACDTVIHTGHTANVFSAHFLPSSSRIVTCAADHQVRLFDIVKNGQIRNGELTSGDVCTKILKCHSTRVKRVVTQDSPSYFLTVSEDRTVRDHDLRKPHTCPDCPTPLLRLPHPLSTLATSPLAPWLIVVAGESAYAHLFDRRMIRRILQLEWGVPGADDDANCVRRFGRASRASGERARNEYISGSRMSQTNGHEVLLSYMTDAVYLYSVYDDPTEPGSISNASSVILSSNSKRRRLDTDLHPSSSIFVDSSSAAFLGLGDQTLEVNSDGDTAGSESMDTDSNMNADGNRDSDSLDSEEEPGDDCPSRLIRPIVFPRRRFVGACNVETVKDVNFLGAKDEFVTSGSDDGNWFLWSKDSGELKGIWEGDGSVVNAIEPHPTLPLVAVSGIDETVKLFSPDRPSSESGGMSRMSHAQSIVSANSDPLARLARARRLQLEDLAQHLGIRPEQLEGSQGECVIMASS
ncbi:hypothetical protein BS47DRAFT_1331473 [Hydnum rufescens UP504]|uniref:WD40 repeat-like protein n=1 Tax=Hydnum rufescens UP504 TaxID=1448309 RepID=A0A9P6AU07_9AGAM|nr:hypothetical protein BS47DRAFT_1331473 [Hydnum rufescens UP504]